MIVSIDIIKFLKKNPNPQNADWDEVIQSSPPFLAHITKKYKTYNCCEIGDMVNLTYDFFNLVDRFPKIPIESYRPYFYFLNKFNSAPSKIESLVLGFFYYSLLENKENLVDCKAYIDAGTLFELLLLSIEISLYSEDRILFKKINKNSMEVYYKESLEFI